MPLSSKEGLLQRWQRHFHGRTHISFQELLYSLRQRQLLETLFCLFDRDSSSLLSESEWIGSIYKIAEASNRTKNVRSLETFLHRFQHLSEDQNALALNDFCKLFDDLSVSLSLSLFPRKEVDDSLVRLVPSRIRLVISRRIQSVDDDGIPRCSPRGVQVRLFLSLVRCHRRCSSSVKSDTKWLSWIAHQFHTTVSKHSRTHAHSNPPVDETMDLETFKNSFYFKVVRMSCVQKNGSDRREF